MAQTSPYLTREPIDVVSLLAPRSGDGAVALFLGVVRDENDGHPVVAIDYQAFEPMAEQELARIGSEIETRWPQAESTLVHRLGRLELGDASVAIVVSSPHRDDAFAACRHAIERIKASVPIWKKEYGPAGESWAQGTTELQPAPKK